jgi:hypothetical protein
MLVGISGSARLALETRLMTRNGSRAPYSITPLTVASGCGGLACCFRAVQVNLETVTRRKALRQRSAMKHLGRLLFLDRA